MGAAAFSFHVMNNKPGPGLRGPEWSEPARVPSLLSLLPCPQATLTFFDLFQSSFLPGGFNGLTFLQSSLYPPAPPLSNLSTSWLALKSQVKCHVFKEAFPDPSNRKEDLHLHTSKYVHAGAFSTTVFSNYQCHFPGLSGLAGSLLVSLQLAQCWAHSRHPRLGTGDLV